jgi:RNA polymerase sigma-70 factor (ECF subfamily)
VASAHAPIASPVTAAAGARATVFTEARPLLFAVAYRMLGSIADAEDVVQDAYLRWQQAPEEEIRTPRAYLTTIVTRLAINQLQSARHRRESYVGPWLPEPIVTEHAPDPAEPIELAESLSMAFMLMLERLSPVERAVLLLHDVFDFEYGEIARVVDRSEANCRQLLSRAKKHLGKAETRFDADPAQAERLLERFNAAANAGDVDGMLAVLADDITLWTDGGGKARGATLAPVHGAEHVARFLAGVAPRWAAMERTIRPAQINGHPGFLVYVEGRAHVAVIFEVRDGRIQAIYSISNPDKLRALPELA